MLPQVRYAQSFGIENKPYEYLHRLHKSPRAVSTFEPRYQDRRCYKSKYHTGSMRKKQDSISERP